MGNVMLVLIPGCVYVDSCSLPFDIVVTVLYYNSSLLLLLSLVYVCMLSLTLFLEINNTLIDLKCVRDNARRGVHYP